ncbi:MAG: hypothetical protein LBF16_10070 [Pseudomonadales bacterium]|jgi:hypothetical protein|nr:hypothetical protein [Pseudomonadales bacterium]
MNFRTHVALITTLATLTLVPAVQTQAADRPAPPAPPSLLFKESWTETKEAVPLAQNVVSNPALTLTVYGAAPEVNSEGGTPHVWTGLCSPACAVTLKLKDSYADLSGKAHIKWYSKTSGFHEIRPMVKLADGTLLVSNFADAYTYDYRTVEFYPADMQWLTLDPATLTTKGQLRTTVDLSKVDEIGFVDLTPGSGHGLGGFSNVGWIEVYANATPR